MAKRSRTRRVVVRESEKSPLQQWGTIVAIIGAAVAAIWQIGSFTSTVTQKFTELTGKVDLVSQKVDTKNEALSGKIDSAAAGAQQKVDGLKDVVDKNHQEVVTFQGSVTDAFKQVFQTQRDLGDKINQERVDRLSDGKKK